jgi:WD40 repeat protein
MMLIATILLASCQPGPSAQATASPTPFTPAQASSTATQPAEPTATPAPTATSAPTEAPTTLPAGEWPPLTYANAPLPPLAGEITAENAYAVLPLAVWGNPRANTLAISADGQILAIGTDLGADFYDSQSYALLAKAHTPHPVTSIAFSPDNGLIALGQEQGLIDVLTKADLSLLIRLTPEQPEQFLDQTIELAFSPNSANLTLMAQSPEQVRLLRWSTESWLITANQTLDQGLVSYLSAPLDLAGVLDEQTNLLMQSLSYPEESDQVDLPGTISQVFWDKMAIFGGEIAPASDGTFILINNGVAVASWHILSGEYDYLLDDYPASIPDPCTQAPASCRNTNGGFSWACDANPNISPIELIALTPDDIMVLISRNDGLTEFRSATDTRVLWTIDVNFTAVSFSPGGEFFFGLRPNGVIEKRATLDGTLIDFLDQNPSALTDLAFAPDGSILAASFADGWVRIYGSADGQLLGVLNGSATALAFSPDGDILAAGLQNGTIRLFNLLTGDFSDLGPKHFARINDLSFNFDGTQLLAGSADCTLSLWQAEDGYRIRLLYPGGGDPFQIGNVAQVRSGEWLIASGNQTSAVTYDTADFLASRVLNFGPYSDLALSSDDATLVLAGEQVRLGIRANTQTDQSPLAITEADLDLTYKIAFSPDNTLLTMVSEETLSFWSLENREVVADLAYPLAGDFYSEAVSLAFSPYGDLIALGMENGLIQIFGIPTTVNP